MGPARTREIGIVLLPVTSCLLSKYRLYIVLMFKPPQLPGMDSRPREYPENSFNRNSMRRSRSGDGSYPGRGTDSGTIYYPMALLKLDIGEIIPSSKARRLFHMTDTNADKHIYCHARNSMWGSRSYVCLFHDLLLEQNLFHCRRRIRDWCHF